MADPNSTLTTPIRPEDLMLKYGIKKDAYYDRIKFLKLKIGRDSDRRSFLTEDQIIQMDALHSHIEENGKMEGFIYIGNSLVVADSNSLEQSAEKITATDNTETSQGDQFQAIVRSAAEYAAGMEIAKFAIAKQMQDNPDLLPKDLKAQVEAVKGQCIPKSQDPKAIAQQFLSQNGISA